MLSPQGPDRRAGHDRALLAVEVVAPREYRVRIGQRERVITTGCCAGDVHTAERNDHSRGMLSINAVVAELSTYTVAQEKLRALLSHDEAVSYASRCVAHPDARQRLHSPRQQLIATVAEHLHSA